jgi:hypothetical protein
VIFPPLPVHGLVELLGDVEAVHHRAGVGQPIAAGGMERRGHVRPVGPHLLPLLLRELVQAGPARRLVPPLGHGQHLGPLGAGQVREDGDVQLVPLLQAQLVDAHVRDHAPGVDLFGLGVGHLVADDQADGLRRNPQSPRDFLLVAADQRPEHVLLEAEGVADVAPLERRDQVLAVVAEGAAVEGGLVDPEAGLAPEVEIPHHVHGLLDLNVGLGLPAAAVAAAAGRPGPGNLEAVAVTVAVVGGDGHAGGQIDVNGDRGHGRP